MVKTKSDELTSSSLPTPLSVDKAVAEGKFYNPINGLELKELLLKRIDNLLYDEELKGNVPYDLRLEIISAARRQFDRHPALNTDSIAYPKADVWLGVTISLSESSTMAKIVVAFGVKEHPQEENRTFGDQLQFLSKTSEWNKAMLVVEEKFNLDAIPPDATRILNDLPITTPVKTPSSGPSGEPTYIDTTAPASEKQKEAVVKQFGKADKGSKK